MSQIIGILFKMNQKKDLQYRNVLHLKCMLIILIAVTYTATHMRPIPKKMLGQGHVYNNATSPFLRTLSKYLRTYCWSEYLSHSWYRTSVVHYSEVSCCHKLHGTKIHCFNMRRTCLGIVLLDKAGLSLKKMSPEWLHMLSRWAQALRSHRCSRCCYIDFALHLLMQWQTVFTNNSFPMWSQALCHNPQFTVMLVCNTVPPEGSKVTGIQGWFLALSYYVQRFRWVL